MRPEESKPVAGEDPPHRYGSPSWFSASETAASARGVGEPTTAAAAFAWAAVVDNTSTRPAASASERAALRRVIWSISCRLRARPGIRGRDAKPTVRLPREPPGTPGDPG